MTQIRTARGAFSELRTIRSFIKQERHYRENVFRHDASYRKIKVDECNRALAALDRVETIFIPNMVQADLLEGPIPTPTEVPDGTERPRAGGLKEARAVRTD